MSSGQLCSRRGREPVQPNARCADRLLDLVARLILEPVGESRIRCDHLTTLGKVLCRQSFKMRGEESLSVVVLMPGRWIALGCGLSDRAP